MDQPPLGRWQQAWAGEEDDASLSSATHGYAWMDIAPNVSEKKLAMC
jgi:hypothetical protein